MIIVAIIAIVLVVAVIGFFAMKKGAAAQTPVVAAAKPAAVPAAAVQAPAPVASELKPVNCLTKGSMHGAMPPFGKLSLDAGALIFEATTRIVAGTTSGLAADDDGASTMQSIGSMESGSFRFEIQPDRVKTVAFDGKRAIVTTQDQVYVFEGLGVSSKQLKPWLEAQGFGA